MNPVRIVRCLCGNFQSEIDMGDYTKKIALTSSGGTSHSRGESIIAKTGFFLGYNVDIEKKVEFKIPYKPNENSRNKRQSQVDIVYSNHESNELSLIEYETTDLIENKVKSKIEKWNCFFPNPHIKLHCVIVVNLYKEKVEQTWELKDRSKLVDLFRSGLQNISKENSDNCFSIISINDDSITYHLYKQGKEETQEYKTNWR